MDDVIVVGAGVFAHPLRARIVREVASVGEMSPKGLVDALTVGGEAPPLGNVSYHVRRLAESGVLKLAGTSPRRGALEHHYRLGSLASVEALRAATGLLLIAATERRAPADTAAVAS